MLGIKKKELRRSYALWLSGMRSILLEPGYPAFFVDPQNDTKWTNMFL